MSFIQAFGFHSDETFTIQNRGEWLKEEDVKSMMGSHLIGYTSIPLLSSIGGICHITIGIMEKDTPAPFRAALIGRGITEMLGGGYLLIIPDIIVSIGRHCCYRRHKIEEPQEMTLKRITDQKMEKDLKKLEAELKALKADFAQHKRGAWENCNIL